MIDALAYEPQFLDHIAPVWRALPSGLRGTFFVDPSLETRGKARGVSVTPRPRPRHDVVPHPDARTDGPPALVASYGDLKEGRRFGYGPFVFIEHGIGQSYGNRRNGSYAGGPDRSDNELILVPNASCAAVWHAAYPKARVEIVGGPRLDSLPRREGGGPPTVALSFHWPAPLSISGYAGTAVGDYYAALPKLAEAFHVIGHAHPKFDWPARMERVYARYGIEFVPDFDDVCRRADVYVADNTSTIFEFAATGRPVVLLNAKAWSRKASYGLRFWDAAHVGINVWPRDDVVDAVRRAFVDAPETRADRDDALRAVYDPRSGGAALAADAITMWMRSRESRRRTA